MWVCLFLKVPRFDGLKGKPTGKPPLFWGGRARHALINTITPFERLFERATRPNPEPPPFGWFPINLRTAPPPPRYQRPTTSQGFISPKAPRFSCGATKLARIRVLPAIGDRGGAAERGAFGRRADGAITWAITCLALLFYHDQSHPLSDGLEGNNPIF